jgi:hypothetical protein
MSLDFEGIIEVEAEYNVMILDFREVLTDVLVWTGWIYEKT